MLQKTVTFAILLTIHKYELAAGKQFFHFYANNLPPNDKHLFRQTICRVTVTKKNTMLSQSKRE